jgi:hypothetical protein
MRPEFVLFVTLLSAGYIMGCHSESYQTEGANSDGCFRGMAVYEEELQKAIELAPSCESDSDCVLFSANVSNCRFLIISVCETVVHRVTAKTFESSDVKNRICKAAGNGPEACAVSGICAGGPTTPACESGECIAK